LGNNGRFTPSIRARGTVATPGRAARAELRGGWRRAKFSVAGPIARRDDELTALPPTLAFRAALESAGVITAEDLIASNDL
jgi:hypothetical protein